MRRIGVVFVVVLLTVTAGCSGLTGTSTENVQSQNGVTGASTGSDQSIAVSAGGQIQVAPDKAIIRVAVTSQADSVETVRQELAQNVSRMRTALEEAGLDAGQIVSDEYDIRRNYERRERPDAPKYRGQHRLVISLNDTNRTGDIVVTAVENGATRVDEIRFTISPETRRELRKRALSKAVENARGKAGVMANGTGLTITGVRTIRTTDVSLRTDRREEAAYATASDSGGGGVPTSFEGGKVTVTARVTVVYNATSG
ncbi:MAG: SIMPL domain-containing protein [Halolamina sp.]